LRDCGVECVIDYIKEDLNVQIVDMPGVKRAVFEVFEEPTAVFADSTWMVRI
jgi:hypothetical protein